MSLYIKTCLRRSLINSALRYSTTSPEVSEAIESAEPILLEDEDKQAREAEIEKKRNTSRLNPPHFNIINGRRPYAEPYINAHKTVKYNRKLYGTYGAASGINPSLCWPTKNELQEKQEFESVAYPFTIQEMMQTAEERKKQRALEIQQRDNEIAAKFAKLDQWKKDLVNKVNKKMAETVAAKEKKDRLVEEVRRHFGFKMDPRDERFQEMLAKREKEQKKLEKIARREAKEKMMLAKIQQQNADLKKE